MATFDANSPVRRVPVRINPAVRVRPFVTTLPPGPPTPPPPVVVPPFPGVLETLLTLVKQGVVRKPIAMAEQILGPRDQVADANGNPVAGGTIDVFAAGTTTRVTTYSDSNLTQENTNPVTLNGSGRANIWIATQEVDIQIRDSAGTLLIEELGLNPNNVDGGFDGGLVPNGSFELDSNADDVPDGWLSQNNAAGSNNGLETGAGNTGAGAQSWRTQSSGNGGGELVTANAFEVNDFDDLVVRFVLRSTVATVRNIVRVEWYDVSDVLISNTDVYDSTANPATFTQQTLVATPPSGARLARIRIFGGTTGGLLAGITYWDNFNVQYPPVVVGQFDNILISGNDIVSTDTNGAINITPNGTGTLTLGGGQVNINPNTAVAGTLTVTGALTGSSGGFSGALTANSLATVAGATVGTTLGVVGATDLDGALDVAGAATFQTTIAATGDISSLGSVTGNSLVTAGVGSVGTLLVTSVLPVDLVDSVASLRIGPADGVHIEMDSAVIQAKASETTVSTLSLNSLGGQLILGQLSANAVQVRLRNQSTLVEAQQNLALTLRNQADGNPAITAAQSTTWEFQTSGGVQTAQFGFPVSTRLLMKNSVHGGLLGFQGENTSGITRTLLELDPENQAATFQARVSSTRGVSMAAREVTANTSATVAQNFSHYWLDTGNFTVTIELGFAAGDWLMFSFVTGATALNVAYATGTTVNGTLSPATTVINTVETYVYLNVGNDEWIAREWPNI